MKKIALVFYSYTGHTKQIVQMIKENVTCDVFELKPKVPYSDDYNQVVVQGQEEVEREFEPELEVEIDISDYDIILLGSPIWWYTFAPTVRSFLTNTIITNQKIIPFFTNGGYGVGHSFKDMKELCPNSEIVKPLDIPFDEDELKLSEDKIMNWIKENVNE